MRRMVFNMLVLFRNSDVDVDGMGSNLADNAMMRFNMTILVDGGGDVVILAIRLR